MNKLLLILIIFLAIAGVQAKEEVVIGVIGPMSLPEGQAELKAVKLAVEEINAKGGILGLPVRVVWGDTKLDPNTATSEFRRLATVEKADVIIGGFSSGVMLSMMETMAETKTLFLADSSSPACAEKVASNYERYKYWFRISQNNGTTFALDLADMIKFLRENGYEVKKVYIIRDEHIWTDAVMAKLRPLLEGMGVEIVKDVRVPRGYTEYEQLILEAEDLKADLIMPILAIAGTGDILAKQWGTLKPKILLAGSDVAACDDPEFYNKTNGLANYEIFITHGGVVITAPPTEMCKHFIEAYKAKYGHYPEAMQAYGAYDAVYLYKTVVEMAAKANETNPFDPDVIVRYVERFNESNPIELTRVIAFYKNHDLVWGDEFVRNWISQWQDGKQYIIHPENVANGKLKLPPWFKEEEKPKTPGFELALAALAVVIAIARARK